jgi:hypothetical protein
MKTLVPTRARVLDEATARRDLRRQIAHLEAQLQQRAPGIGEGGARLLGLAELSATRDALAHAIAREQAQRSEEGDGIAFHRRLLEAALADPPAHKWLRIPLDALGEPACGAYEVRPRLGLVGMLAGWWEVKLSSGCP